VPAGARRLWRGRTAIAVAVLLAAAGLTAFLLLRSAGGPEHDAFRVSGHPTAVSVAGGQVWVAAPGSGAVTVLDAATGRRLEPPIQTGGAPARLALGAKGAWVADTARGAVVPVRRGSGRAYDPIPVGADVADVALGAGAVWALSSAEGVVRTLEPGGARVRTLNVGRDPVDVAADARRVVVAAAGDGSLTWIDAKARRVGGRIDVGGVPDAVALSGDTAWVTDAEHASVARVNLRTEQVTRMRVGERPIAVAADGDELYVLCAGDRMLWHLDGADGALNWKRPAGAQPTALALDADSVWVTDASADSVIRLER
jgi:DNA-binding beta-propeller fold protein YncE